MLHDSIRTGTWASVGDRPAIDYAVLDDEVEFRFGNRENPFDIMLSEQGLTRFIEQATAALAKLRAGEHDEGGG